MGGAVITEAMMETEIAAAEAIASMCEREAGYARMWAQKLRADLVKWKMSQSKDD